MLTVLMKVILPLTCTDLIMYASINYIKTKLFTVNMRKKSNFYQSAMQMLQLKGVFITVECSINSINSEYSKFKGQIEARTSVKMISLETSKHDHRDRREYRQITVLDFLRQGCSGCPLKSFSSSLWRSRAWRPPLHKPTPSTSATRPRPPGSKSCSLSQGNRL